MSCIGPGYDDFSCAVYVVPIVTKCLRRRLSLLKWVLVVSRWWVSGVSLHLLATLTLLRSRTALLVIRWLIWLIRDPAVVIRWLWLVSLRRLVRP